MPTLPIPTIAEIANITGNSRAASAAIMKHIIMDRWNSWVHEENGCLPGKIAKKKGTMGGQLMLSEVRTRVLQSAGIAAGEGRPLPHPDSGESINPRMFSRDCYSRIRTTGQVRRATKGSNAAWVAATESDLADARVTMGLNFTRQIDFGYYDVIGVVKSAGAISGDQSVVTLYGRNDRTSGVTTPANAFKLGAFQCREGMMIAFIDSSNLANAPAYSMAAYANLAKIVEVDESDPDNPTITVKGSIADGGNTLTTIYDNLTGDLPSDGDLIIAYGSRADSIAGDASKDSSFFTMNGWDAVVQGSGWYDRLYGIAKTSTTKLSGIVLTNTEAQRAFGEMLLTTALHRVRTEGTGGKPDCVRTEFSGIREVVVENRSQREFEAVQRNSGYAPNLQHTAGDTMTTYEADWLCRPGMFQIIASKDWGYYEESPLGPVDEGGRRRWVQDYDQEEVILHKSGNIVCQRPHNNGQLDDVRFDVFAPPST